MAIYTKKQADLLRPSIYSAYSEYCRAYVQVKAYLKENAIASLQKTDPNIKESDVKKTGFINSHQSPVDRIVDAGIFNETFKIVLDSDL